MAFTATATKAIPAAAAVLLLLIGPGARAQQPSQDQIAAIRASCRSDFMANCSGVTPGGKDALECLKRNLAKLSGSCKTAVSAITPAPAPPATAGVARSCTLPVGRGVTAGFVKREAGCRPQADTPSHGQTRALGSAGSGRGTSDCNGGAGTGRHTGGSQCDGAAAAGGAAHRPHLRGRPASVLRRRAAGWRTNHCLSDAQPGRPVAAMQERTGDGPIPVRPTPRRYAD